MVSGMPPTTSGIKADTSRIAYYEQIRASLRASIETKLRLDEQLGKLSTEIDTLESKYRKDTPAGNLVYGFDNYVRNVTSGSAIVGAGPARRKGQIAEVGSFFNRVTNDPAVLVPKIPATPTVPINTNVASKPGQKKRKSTVMPEPEEGDGKPSKRGKVVYGRE